MSDGLDSVPLPEEVWPPSPTLPPMPVRPPSFLGQYPVLARLLLCTNLAVVGSGANYSLQWLMHHAHTVDWVEVWAFGAMTFFGQLVVHVGIPYMARREKPQREGKAAALEAEAME